VERQAVGLVLATGDRRARARAGADPEVQPAAGHDVDGRRDLRQHRRRAEAVAGDEDADAQALGLRGRLERGRGPLPHVVGDVDGVGRRHDLVDAVEDVVGEVDAVGGEVALEVLHRGAAGPRALAALAIAVRQPPARQRAVGEHAEPVAPARGQHVVLGRADEDRVRRLLGVEALAAPALGHPLRLDDLRCGARNGRTRGSCRRARGRGARRGSRPRRCRGRGGGPGRGRSSRCAGGAARRRRRGSASAATSRARSARGRTAGRPWWRARRRRAARRRAPCRRSPPTRRRRGRRRCR